MRILMSISIPNEILFVLYKLQIKEGISKYISKNCFEMTDSVAHKHNKHPIWRIHRIDRCIMNFFQSFLYICFAKLKSLLSTYTKKKKQISKKPTSLMQIQLGVQICRNGDRSSFKQTVRPLIYSQTNAIHSLNCLSHGLCSVFGFVFYSFVQITTK